MKKKNIIGMIMFFSLWTLFVLYPNPYRLFISLYRIIYPPINPMAVTELVGKSPSKALEVEEFVLREIPYQFDWQTYGVPFYFPTPEEVMSHKTGDCKSRFVVLASLFEALDIPYQQSFSLRHFWVDYDDKKENSLEKDDNAFFLRTEEGFKIQMPREDFKEIRRTLREGFWEVMPLPRKVLLLLGFPLTIIMGFLIKH